MTAPGGDGEDSTTEAVTEAEGTGEGVAVAGTMPGTMDIDEMVAINRATEGGHGTLVPTWGVGAGP